MKHISTASGLLQKYFCYGSFIVCIRLTRYRTIASPWLTKGSQRVRDHETFVRLRVRDLILMRDSRTVPSDLKNKQTTFAVDLEMV